METCKWDLVKRVGVHCELSETVLAFVTTRAITCINESLIKDHRVMDSYLLMLDELFEFMLSTAIDESVIDACLATLTTTNGTLPADYDS